MDPELAHHPTNRIRITNAAGAFLDISLAELGARAMMGEPTDSVTFARLTFAAELLTFQWEIPADPDDENSRPIRHRARLVVEDLGPI